MSNRLKIVCITIILLSMVSLLPAQEDDVLQHYEIKKERIVGGHYFTPANAIKTPFILTHVRTSLGIGGINDLKYPLVEVGEQDYLYMQGDILAAVLVFEYQHAVKEWLAVFARFGLTARIGSSFATLTTQGINYATTFNVGWMINIMRKEKFTLAASFEVTSGSYSLINLQKFVDDILNGAENPTLTNKNNTVFGLAGLRAAYGINKFIGFTGLFDIGYGETPNRDSDSKFFPVIGLNADMNFYSLINTPLSLSLGYIYSSYPEENAEIVYSSNVLVAQLSYIGRSDFILSLDLIGSREKTKSIEETVWLTTATFSMKYLF